MFRIVARHWKIVLPALLLFTGSGWLVYSHFEDEREEEQSERMRELALAMREEVQDVPAPRYAADWLDCLNEWPVAEGSPADRVVCASGTGQGVTSTLVGLRFGDDYVPVIESRLEGKPEDQRVIVEIVGGPGDPPFYSNPAVTEDMVEAMRGEEGLPITGGILVDSPQFQLMNSGFTIASIGYWGTRLRTLNEPDEIELAMRDVALVINHYRDKFDSEPPLVALSLGNHLALGALGKERLESMQFLALVPVMDGLQHHLRRVMASEEWASDDETSGDWNWRNIYTRSDNGMEFLHRRMTDAREYNPQYIGYADFPFRDVDPQDECSVVVLGERDERTAEYLERTPELPPFVEVWGSDHFILRSNTGRARGLFADFAGCLLADARST